MLEPDSETDLPRLIEVDDFLAQLWKIHLSVKSEGYTHQHALGMFRSDYMLDIPETKSRPSLKQVEFNTISSSFGGLAALVTKMHTELSTFPTPSQPLAYPAHSLFSQVSKSTSAHSPQASSTISNPPINTAVSTLCSGLAAAHQAYGASKHSPSLPLCVLFLVQDSERNIFDQLALSTHLFNHYRISSFRLPTSSILSSTFILPTATNPARPLIYTPPSSPHTPYEASVVYFRALYAPTEYTSPSTWAARHHLERSSAIKCPSILLHLSGSKKIQQVLTSVPPSPSHLTALLPATSPDLLESLRSTFANQYSMTSAEGIKLATNPDTALNHVLKPQREGGGNNIYRHNIPTFLKSIPETDWKSYILMELIRPPAAAKNTVLRSDGNVVSGNVVSELGVFGTCLWKVDTSGDAGKAEGGEVVLPSEGTEGRLKRPMILHNEEGGYLLRTKASGSDEGGVAAGFSSLDSIILYDEEG